MEGSTSHLPLFILHTKLGEAPLYNRPFTEFAPSLHRLWYGGRTKDHRRMNESKSIENVLLFLGSALCKRKKRITHY